ncbi:MAG: tRNA (cytidine(34)-2'-O)-methyltransferase [Candidatus Gastranaerophilales bacterium]|nr:tRNA (cytidine(34)-2'-O)-methyltransferase [Candidatus Gastranaerophilales bacterium]
MSNNEIKKSFNIVLVEPEIPQNTGNIVRLCACTGAKLFLVGKLGFSITDKYLKRAGLDYWDSAVVAQFNHIEDLKQKYPDSRFFYLTTKTTQKYTDINFQEGDFLVFGPETRGLDEELLNANKESCLTIPMKENQRSLNLSNSVAIVVYEAIRQTNG